LVTTGLDLDVLGLGEICRHLEVEHVAGVVLDDVQHAAPPSTAFVASSIWSGRRRGEDLAGTGGIEHPAADEATVHRLVARAAARDDPDLALLGRVGADDHHRIVDHAHVVAMGRLDPLERLAHHRIRLVDQLLHAASTR
jgi:hypothetical protein